MGSMYSTVLEVGYIIEYGIQDFLKIRLITVNVTVIEECYLFSMFVYFDPFISRQWILIGGAICAIVLLAIHELDATFLKKLSSSELTTVWSYRKATHAKAYINNMKHDFNDIFGILPAMWLLCVFIKLSGQIIRLQVVKSQNFNVLAYFLYELALSVFFIASLVYIDEKLEEKAYMTEMALVQSSVEDPLLIVAQEQLVRKLKEQNKLSAMSLFGLNRQLGLNFINALISTTLLLLQIPALT
ncbi:hypothetical protein HDE_08250 [Halotydeus destructor]|nr:hypothetical protein HDE_08250 [Halotydeus destructor]